MARTPQRLAAARPSIPFTLRRPGWISFSPEPPDTVVGGLASCACLGFVVSAPDGRYGLRVFVKSPPAK